MWQQRTRDRGEGHISASLTIFSIFLRLGLTAFGGPIAHLARFRATFVDRRRWLTNAQFADLLALCQFLPGPASSQAGFAIGLHRAGPFGGLAAWLGFTLPSAVLMTAFAFVAPQLGRSAAGALHGLKLVAVAIVAQAVWSMARSLAPDARRAAISAATLALVLLAPGFAGQVAAILLGAAAGLALCRGPTAAPPTPAPPSPISHRTAIACLVLFGLLLAAALVATTRQGAFAVFAAFTRAGALVFGGGHVVLPLLRDAIVTPGWVPERSFLAGYGAAQAMPGPLFTFAAFLGASLHGPVTGLTGALLATIAIFLPGLLLVTGVWPFWHAVRAIPQAGAALRGVNAAVVGLLAAALYSPVWTGAVTRPADVAVVAASLALLVAARAAPVLVVALGALAGVVAG
jgi:chromate transporter